MTMDMAGTNATDATTMGRAQQQMQLSPPLSGGACLSVALRIEQLEPGRSHVSVSTPMKRTKNIAVTRNAFVQKATIYSSATAPGRCDCAPI